MIRPYTNLLHTKYVYGDGMARMKLLATIDLESIEAILESHMGPDFTIIVLKCGERLTVHESFNDVKRRLVHMSLECQLGEVMT